MLIDCHTHAFADKIAAKAVEQLISYYKIPTSCGGRLPDLCAAANQADLDALVLLVAATKPEQVRPANDWILSLAGASGATLTGRLGLSRIPRLIPFGTFHRDDPEWLAEIRRLRGAGIKGLKLHPEFQGIDLADPALGEFFEEVEPDFVLMVHVGDPEVSPDNFSTPKKVARILRDHPGLRIIAAHLGGYCFWEETLAELAGKNLYLDTSSALPYIPDGLLRAIIRKHDIEKILFGSDYPLTSPENELRLIDRIDWLSAAEKELILGENCRRLLDLSFVTPETELTVDS
jgi:predicted TIM-barrel fold metal-dependent hydrolase